MPTTRDYAELDRAMDELDAQSELYRPGSFWRDASKGIVRELKELGVERFRRIPLALSFYAPTYGAPGIGFSKSEMERLSGAAREFSPKGQLAVDYLISGTQAAHADYRVLIAADDPSTTPHLHTFSESNIGEPLEQFDFDGRKLSRSSLNYVLGLCMLKKHLGGSVPRRVLEIGGGFGTLGDILSQASIPNLRYIDVDIPPTSYIAQYYLSSIVGADKLATYASTRERASIDIESLPELSVLCSWQIEKLQGQIDLFVNFISFQEMEPPIVRNYLSHVRRLGAEWVLLRNLREGQRRKTDHNYGVETPIISDDYPTMLPDYELVERSVWPFGFKTVDGYHSELLRRVR
jgi:putative sugar O-methyltransferase